jgi:hypothetical protein
LAVYFARHGEFLSIPVEEVIPHRDLNQTLRWFRGLIRRLQSGHLPISCVSDENSEAVAGLGA